MNGLYSLCCQPQHHHIMTFISRFARARTSCHGYAAVRLILDEDFLTLPADDWSKDDAKQDKLSNEKEGADRLGEQCPWVPRNIIIVRRRFSSTIGTQMKPSTSGTGLHSNLTQITPTIPKSATRRTSKGQLDRLYTPNLRLTLIHASLPKGLTFEKNIYNSGQIFKLYSLFNLSIFF
jgi:hypothetical protein